MSSKVERETDLLPRLDRSIVETASRGGHGVVSAEPLPERVLQFGTGAFLRGFVDYFLYLANRQGKLNGSIVMVGSTGSGRVRQVNDQDGLYSLVVRGREGAEVVDDSTIVDVVSRALAASDSWNEVLIVARSPHLELIVSNTTEVGIRLDPDDRIDLDPPRSFPGKLTAVLYERARAFDYNVAHGLVILPCELLENNGDQLRSFVCELADRWNLGQRFKSWLDQAVTFCNTLVDRIVPGTPEHDESEALFRRLGYSDQLLTVAEPYRLFAIEGGQALMQRLPFVGADPGIIVADDITPYRERKVRILNGTHTVMTPVALLAGLHTVCEAVEHPIVGRYVRHVLNEEIVPSLDSDAAMARAFAAEVLDRFANPFVRHDLLGITFQQTVKVKVRVVPSIAKYHEKHGVLPRGLLVGFACFLLFQRPDCGPPAESRPKDDSYSDWLRRWEKTGGFDRSSLRRFVEEVSADEGLWGIRLDALSGFVDQVVDVITAVRERGLVEILQELLPEAGG